MNLLTWNIQWALGMDGRMDPARIVADARAIADFDVLCLQEVADNFPELEGEPAGDQFAEFARLLPGYTAISGPALEIMDGQGCPKRFGNMLLSRLPVIQTLRHTLPWEAAATRNMPRGLIEATLATPYGPLRVQTTHLDYSHPLLRQAQVAAIRDLHRAAVARCGSPRENGPGMYVRVPTGPAAILCGDFNMTPDDATKLQISAPFADGTPRLMDAWSALHGAAPHPFSAGIDDPKHAAPFCCDYAFVSEDLLPRVTSIRYDLTTRASDHQPVLVEVDLERDP